MLCRSNGIVSNNVLVVLTPDMPPGDHTVEDAAGWLAQLAVNSCETTDTYAVVGACTRHFADLDPSRRHIVMVCHQVDEAKYYFNSKFTEGVVTHESKFSTPALSPDRLIDCINDVAFPGAISVSGISQEFAAEIWTEIVSRDRTFLDGHGQGLMVHPMYIYNSERGVFSIREISSAFGW